MRKFLMYILGGYAAGSVLFARLSAALLNRPAVLRDSPDGNPGTANAFQYGGFLCGLITLLGDVAKGFLPVYLYLRAGGNFQAAPLLSALVLAAPVWGHASPILFRFQGGKGIAVTFGCLLGLRPATGVPFALLALFFLFFSLVLRIRPNSCRTAVVYLCTLAGTAVLRCPSGVILGFALCTAAVFLRLHLSREVRERPSVRLLWLDAPRRSEETKDGETPAEPTSSTGWRRSRGRWSGRH